MVAVAKIFRILESPVGPLLLAGDSETLMEIAFQSGKHARTIPSSWEQCDGSHEEAARQLREYFAGARTEFELRLEPEGTPFQQRVWNELRGIPYGETISYRELAERVGNPAGTRAVGAANGRNPLPIVVPCHRVIGSDGSLTGFGGGLQIKRKLLDLESRFAGARG